MRKKWTPEKVKEEYEKTTDKNKYILLEYSNIDKGKYSRITFKCCQCGHIFAPTIRQYFHLKQRCAVCNVGEKWNEKRFEKLYNELPDKNNYILLEKEEIKNKNSKLTMKCTRCQNIWSVSCANFLKLKTRCNVCKSSRGEREISILLNEEKIEFISQYKPKGCRNKRQLVFDFYLVKENIIIEFHGQQHVKSVKFFGGTSTFEKLVENDKIKYDFAVSNGYRYEVIWYNEDIKSKLQVILNNYKG